MRSCHRCTTRGFINRTTVIVVIDCPVVILIHNVYIRGINIRCRCSDRPPFSITRVVINLNIRGCGSVTATCVIIIFAPPFVGWRLIIWITVAAPSSCNHRPQARVSYSDEWHDATGGELQGDRRHAAALVEHRNHAGSFEQSPVCTPCSRSSSNRATGRPV